MKFWPRLLAAALCAGLLAFALTGCGNGGSGSTTAATTLAGTTPAQTTTLPTTTLPTTPAPTTPPPPTFDPVVILSCDTLDYNKMGSQITLTTDTPAPGLTSSWLSPAKNHDVVFNAVIPPFDATQNDYMTGALKLLIWCDDPDGLGGGDNQVEFNTAKADNQENSWQWTDQITQVGWNTVYLMWDDANGAGDPADNTSLTWIRIYAVDRTANFMLGQISIVPYDQVPADLAF